MSIARLNAWEAPVVHCFEEKKRHRRHNQKEYADAYGRFVKIWTKKKIGIIGKFVKNCSLEEFTVEGDGPGSGERKKAVMGMSRTGANVWILPSVRERFLSGNDRWF